MIYTVYDFILSIYILPIAIKHVLVTQSSGPSNQTPGCHGHSWPWLIESYILGKWTLCKSIECGFLYMTIYHLWFNLKLHEIMLSYNNSCCYDENMKWTMEETYINMYFTKTLSPVIYSSEIDIMMIMIIMIMLVVVVVVVVVVMMMMMMMIMMTITMMMMMNGLYHYSNDDNYLESHHFIFRENV